MRRYYLEQKACTALWVLSFGDKAEEVFCEEGEKDDASF